LAGDLFLRERLTRLLLLAAAEERVNKLLWLDLRANELFELCWAVVGLSLCGEIRSISFSIVFILSIERSTLSTELLRASDTLSSSRCREGVRKRFSLGLTVGLISVKSSFFT